jgi:methyl-accepting chemotaxis protein
MSETQSAAVPAGKPRPATNDGLAAAQLDIDDLNKRIAQVAEGVGQAEGYIVLRIEKIDAQIEELKMTSNTSATIVEQLSVQLQELRRRVEKLEGK